MIAVVTGASSGLGLETARALGERGFDVVLTGRNEAKTREAADAVRKTAKAQVHVALGDFASLRQVRALADDLRGRFERIDVLVNNAGLYLMRYTTTEDGFETTFGVNHLAPFLLTNLLRDSMAPSARIVNVASIAHAGAKTNRFDDANDEHGFRGFDAYRRSKLANVMFTAALARRLDESGATTTSLHPGFVYTHWGSSGNRVPMRALMTIARPFARSARSAARLPVRLATEQGLEGANGAYFTQRGRKEPAPLARNVDAQERLWELSAKLTGLE